MGTSVKPVRELSRRPSGFGVFLFGLPALLLLLPALFLSTAAGMTAGPGPTAAPGTCRPEIVITSADPRWSSYSDYLEHILTVEESFQNLGSCSSCSLRIDAVLTDRGVSVNTAMPIEIGSMQADAGSNITLKFQIPAGVATFHTRLIASCQKSPDTQPPEAGTAVIDPELAYANEGCPEGPVPGQDGRVLPEEQTYGARRFTVSLTRADGSPAAGRAVKWYLSNETQFRILESTAVTDAAGMAYADVTPPQFFICIVPYFDHGQTEITAGSDYGDAQASFLYTRCAPPGETPPWAAPGSEAATSGA